MRRSQDEGGNFRAGPGKAVGRGRRRVMPVVTGLVLALSTSLALGPLGATTTPLAGATTVTAAAAATSVPIGGSIGCGSPVTAKTPGGPGKTQTASAHLGTYRASVSGRVTKNSLWPQGTLSHLQLTVWASGNQVFKAPVVIPKGAATGGTVDLQTLSSTSSATICVVRFAGVGAGTGVTLEFFTGGAHCCTLLDTYVLRHGGVVTRPVITALGNEGGELVPTATGTILETVDDAFFYEFDAFAGSGAPLVVLVLKGNGMANVTAGYPVLVAKDAKSLWSYYQLASAPKQEGRGGGLGLLAPWVADECVLGKGTSAWATLAKLNAEGRLTGGQYGVLYKPGVFEKDLRHFLAQQGYC